MSTLGQLFIFNSIVWVIIAVSFVLIKKKVKNQKTKDIIFIVMSIVTVIIHYSYLVLQLCRGEKPKIEPNLYTPFYACNVMMWCCTTVSFLMIIKKKNTKVYKFFTEFTAFVGVVCAFFGALVNANFFGNPNMKDYYVLRSLISHSTMLFCCIYLFAMGYIKIDMKHNMLSIVMGEVLMFICGLYSNLILPAGANSMLIERGFDNAFYWINFGGIIISTVGGSLVFFAIYDLIKKPKEERWYHNLWF